LPLKLFDGDVKIHRNGRHYRVINHGDYVVKIPRNEKYISAKVAADICQRTNNAAQYIPEYFLPCVAVDYCIVMKKATGVCLVDMDKKDAIELRNRFLPDVYKRLDEIEMRIADMGNKNLFYDADTDKFTIVDTDKLKYKRE